MNEKPYDPLEGFPDEPDRPEMDTLAHQLVSQSPELAPDALVRVEARMNAEITREQRRRRLGRILAVSGVAAAVLVTGILVWLLQSDPKPVGPSGQPTQPVTERVKDSYPMMMADIPAPSAPDKPLITIDPYRSLFNQ